jgi:quinol monooxygenase YgiN
MIVVTGSVTAREDCFAEVRKLSLEHVHRSRKEAGCISHAVHVDCENPLRLVFIEQWADRAALFRPRPAAARLGSSHARALRRDQAGKLVVHGCVAIPISYCNAT